ncbi:cytochrome c biogenesis CcdA family protein [Streptococcus fryi]
MVMEWFKWLPLFFEGVLSFLSPCVFPILPIYLGILGGQAQEGQVNTRRLLVNTLSFVVGIALTFFLLAFASSLLSHFLTAHRQLLTLISGLLIIFMGMSQIGWLKLTVLNKEWSAKTKIYKPGKTVTPLLALLMGFTFSFAWTPCIGPILASVFFYASSHQGLWSIGLILVYCLGFILPFVLLTLFSSKMMGVLKPNGKWLTRSKVISGYLLIFIGLSILTGFFQNIIRLIY